VKNHPVMKQLLRLRYVLEKMRTLDGKVQPQVDRLLQLARSGYFKTIHEFSFYWVKYTFKFIL